MEDAPKGPYIYQPYGIQNKEHWACERIFAIAGLGILTTIKGLTRKEAETILSSLKALKAAEKEEA